MVTEKQQLEWMDELRKESSRYCKQMGIDRKIDLVFFKEQFIKKVNHKLSHFSPWRKHEYEAMKRLDKDLGCCIRHAGTIFVDIEGWSDILDKEVTLIHELVHFRFPYINHGLKFKQRMYEVIDGKKFPKIRDIECQRTLRELLQKNNADLKPAEKILVKLLTEESELLSLDEKKSIQEEIKIIEYKINKLKSASKDSKHYWESCDYWIPLYPFSPNP